MKRISFTAAIAAAALAASACSDAPSATSPDVNPSYGNSISSTAGNKLQCFDGTTDTEQNPGYGPYTGTCTLIENGATLNTIDSDSDPNNNYAGVYILNSNLGGKLLVDVNKLSFEYSGNSALGGSPRISLPIDENGDGGYEAFAYIDTLGCNDGSPDTGTLDVINDSTCTIWYNNVSYANWADFMAANPTYRIASDALSFIIVDQPGTFTITNVQLGKGPAKSRP